MSEIEEVQAELAAIQSFFSNIPTGFFIEVGANHPTGVSQTYHLEQQGWQGILVEPIAALIPPLKDTRHASHVFHAACTAPDKTGTLTIHIPDNTGLATLEKNVDDPTVQYVHSETVSAVTLNSLVEKVNPPKVHFLSIDTEGTEIDVLRGFNIQKYKPQLILIEDKLINLQKHYYLKSKGYRLVKRTTLNNWYAPKDSAYSPTLLEELKLLRKVYLGLPFRKYHHWRRMKKAKQHNS